MKKINQKVKLQELNLNSFVTTIGNTKKVNGGYNPWVETTGT